MRQLLTFTLVAISFAVVAGDAQAQYRRGPAGRIINSLPVPNWMLRYSLVRPNQTIILPPAQPGTTTGSAAASGSAATPEKTFEIKVVLPVAGANVNVNGIDFGKTEYFERKLNVPESTDDKKHDYIVTAKWMHQGKEVTQSRTVQVGKSGKATANFFVDEKK